MLEDIAKQLGGKIVKLGILIFLGYSLYLLGSISESLSTIALNLEDFLIE